MDETRGTDDHDDARAADAPLPGERESVPEPAGDGHADAPRQQETASPVSGTRFEPSDGGVDATAADGEPRSGASGSHEDETTAAFREAQRLHRLAGPLRLTLRPAARRRALLAGLVSGPFASAGAGFTTLGISAALSTVAGAGPWFPSTTVFLLVGIASLVVAIVLARRTTRSHHRGGVVALGGLALAGLPFIPAAPTIAANVILSLAVRTGEVSAAPEALVFAVCWAALAVIGVVLGPLAFLLVAHLNRGLSPEGESDPSMREKFERTTRRLD